LKKKAQIMATAKHPNEKHDPKKAAHDTTAKRRDATAPEVDAQKPHDDKQGAKADKTRRDAAADAFRNEKAHEPPPKHRA
jgi:hypothetical protein